MNVSSSGSGEGQLPVRWKRRQTVETDDVADAPLVPAATVTPIRTGCYLCVPTK